MPATRHADAPGHGRHVPVRMCVICRGRFAKAVLSRYVTRPQAADGPDRTGTTTPHLIHDAAKRMDGRGVYVCDNPVCRKKFTTFAGRGRKR